MEGRPPCRPQNWDGTAPAPPMISSTAVAEWTRFRCPSTICQNPNTPPMHPRTFLPHAAITRGHTVLFPAHVRIPSVSPRAAGSAFRLSERVTSVRETAPRTPSCARWIPSSACRNAPSARRTRPSVRRHPPGARQNAIWSAKEFFARTFESLPRALESFLRMLSASHHTLSRIQRARKPVRRPQQTSQRPHFSPKTRESHIRIPDPGSRNPQPEPKP
jgi:hypothetical protein